MGSAGAVAGLSLLGGKLQPCCALLFLALSLNLRARENVLLLDNAFLKQLLEVSLKVELRTH